MECHAIEAIIIHEMLHKSILSHSLFNNFSIQKFSSACYNTILKMSQKDGNGNGYIGVGASDFIRIGNGILEDYEQTQIKLDNYGWHIGIGICENAAIGNELLKRRVIALEEQLKTAKLEAKLTNIEHRESITALEDKMQEIIQIRDEKHHEKLDQFKEKFARKLSIIVEYQNQIHNLTNKNESLGKNMNDGLPLKENKIAVLESMFNKNKYLTLQQRANVASMLNLTEIRVRNWFRKRRTKWRKAEWNSRLPSDLN